MEHLKLKFCLEFESRLRSRGSSQHVFSTSTIGYIYRIQRYLFHCSLFFTHNTYPRILSLVLPIPHPPSIIHHHPFPIYIYHYLSANSHMDPHHPSSSPYRLPLFHSPTSTASHLPTTHPLPPTSFLQQDHWNPLAKASYSIKVHASPLTSGSKSCQTLCSGLTSRLPGWWMHVVEVLAVEYSVPQFRHWDCAFRFCGREGLGGV
jgi:hypothetical protein